LAREASVNTVSIVIPAYNAEGFLARSVRSALQQTHPVLEVIIVDDGSSDNTCEVAEALEREDGRVTLIKLPTNGGPSKARNAGFASANGDWIAVLDADDAFLPDRLEQMMRISHDADIVADNLRYYDATRRSIDSPAVRRTSGSETVDLRSFADTRRTLLDLKPMLRRAFVELHHLRYPENLRHGEDFLLMLEALARGAIFRITWNPGYLYTTRNSGWSRTVLDYQGLSTHLIELSARNDLELSQDNRAILQHRAQYAADLQLREQVKSAFQRRKLLSAFTMTVMHPELWKFAVSKVRRALLKR
jgi:succinoglycan biosynthesis protein ExoO